MFTLHENFSEWNAENQPINIERENNSKYRHGFGRTDETGYVAECNGGRNFFKVPSLLESTLSLDISYNPPFSEQDGRENMFLLFFGYDRQKREGWRVRFTEKRKENAVLVSLEKDEVEVATLLEEVTFENVGYLPKTQYPVRMDVKKDSVTVSFLGHTHTFSVQPKKGVLGFSKDKGISELVINHAVITSPETPKKETVLEKTFIVPRYNGGDHDYEIALLIEKYEEGVHEITCTFSGGAMLPPARACFGWFAPYDKFINPFIRFIGDCSPEKLFIKNGKLTFVHDNGHFYNPELRVRHQGEKLPYAKKFYTTNFADAKYFVFGYDFFSHACQELLQDSSEFIFDMDGNLVYYGAPQDKEVRVFVTSPHDKAIVGMVDEAAEKEKELAVRHAKNNHYFTAPEAPHFTATVAHKMDTRFLEFKAYASNVYFKEKKEISISAVTHTTDRFGFTNSVFTLDLLPLPQGVYHITIETIYGSEVADTHHSAFEVLDEQSDVSPQKSAGLPLIYIGDGALQAPNPWNEKPDFNIAHYVDSFLMGPSHSEDKEAWKLTSLYKKNLMIWFDGRTTKTPDFEVYPGTIKNADYITYITKNSDDVGDRLDLFAHYSYNAPGRRKMYNDFVRENPALGLCEIPLEGELDDAFYEGIEKNFDAWATYMCHALEPMYREKQKELKAINPKLKRFSYGPFAMYGVDCVGAEGAIWSGRSPEWTGDIYDGFFQLEDYPFNCDYMTTYGAWVIMSLKAEFGNIRFAPELYDTFDVGCPDGYVVYGNPPMAYCPVKPYQTVTQIYEYLYNAVYYKDGAFHYWNDESMMMYGMYNTDAEERFHTVIKAWGEYRENMPKKPCRTTAYLYRLTPDDTRANLKERHAYNKAEICMYYLYELAAKSGVPSGFITKTLEGITPDMVGMLVLPSTKTLTKEEIQAVRDLHKKGVTLFATSDVEGLEDIFGVKYAPAKMTGNCLFANEVREDVAPFEDVFTYVSDGAKALITTDTNGVVLFENDGAYLMNVCLSDVGMETFAKLAYTIGRVNVSTTIRKVCGEILKHHANHVAYADENCGINVLETENGDTILHLTDYMRNKVTEPRKVTVWLSETDAADVSCISDEALKIQKYTENGVLCGFSAEIKPRQTLLFKLK